MSETNLLDGLIARLKAATGPDRQLDAAIWEAIFPAEQGTLAPDYTTSLDVALTLIPDDWTAWELRSAGRKTRFTAELSQLREIDGGGGWVFGRASTPALAMCIAAINARAGNDEL